MNAHGFVADGVVADRQRDCGTGGESHRRVREPEVTQQLVDQGSNPGLIGKLAGTGGGVGDTEQHVEIEGSGTPRLTGGVAVATALATLSTPPRARGELVSQKRPRQKKKALKSHRFPGMRIPLVPAPPVTVPRSLRKLVAAQT